MGELYPVLAGLDEGERVVVHGAFAIDADLQIQGGDSMMNMPSKRQPAAPSGQEHHEMQGHQH
jgi:Cu(I)/Ag(I) efflux system membrane fusion protein